MKITKPREKERVKLLNVAVVAAILGSATAGLGQLWATIPLILVSLGVLVWVNR